MIFQDKRFLSEVSMNKFEQGLDAADELFAQISAEEFEKQYLEAESELGLTIDEYFGDKT